MGQSYRLNGMMSQDNNLVTVIGTTNSNMLTSNDHQLHRHWHSTTNNCESDLFLAGYSSSCESPSSSDVNENDLLFELFEREVSSSSSSICQYNQLFNNQPCSNFCYSTLGSSGACSYGNFDSNINGIHKYYSPSSTCSTSSSSSLSSNDDDDITMYNYNQLNQQQQLNFCQNHDLYDAVAAADELGLFLDCLDWIGPPPASSSSCCSTQITNTHSSAPQNCSNLIPQFQNQQKQTLIASVMSSPLTTQCTQQTTDSMKIVHSSTTPTTAKKSSKRKATSNGKNPKGVKLSVIAPKHESIQSEQQNILKNGSEGSSNDSNQSTCAGANSNTVLNISAKLIDVCSSQLNDNSYASNQNNPLSNYVVNTCVLETHIKNDSINSNEKVGFHDSSIKAQINTTLNKNASSYLAKNLAKITKNSSGVKRAAAGTSLLAPKPAKIIKTCKNLNENNSKAQILTPTTTNITSTGNSVTGTKAPNRNHANTSCQQVNASGNKSRSKSRHSTTGMSSTQDSSLVNGQQNMVDNGNNDNMHIVANSNGKQVGNLKRIQNRSSQGSRNTASVDFGNLANGQLPPVVSSGRQNCPIKVVAQQQLSNSQSNTIPSLVEPPISPVNTNSVQNQAQRAASYNVNSVFQHEHDYCGRQDLLPTDTCY